MEKQHVHERFDPKAHGVPEIGDPVKHAQIGRPAPGQGRPEGRPRLDPNNDDSKTDDAGSADEATS